MKRNFIEHKAIVIQLIDDCLTFVKQHGYLDKVDRLADLRKRLVEKKITVVVVGEARRGKSTALTALTEESGLFPINVDVTTCVVTLVTYGETEKVTVTFKDGAEKVITRAEIADYADNENNDDNRKNVKYVKIETPNPKLKEGLVYVDTPGIGTLNPMHTAATLEFLPFADVILFVSDVGAPLTASELEFMRTVKSKCKNFIFLLTKIDTQPDYNQILESNRRKIADYTDMPTDNIVYIPLQAETKLLGVKENDAELIKLSGVPALEAALWSNVEANRERIVLAPALSEAAALINDIGARLRQREIELSGSQDEQEALKAELAERDERLRGLQRDGAEWINIIKNEELTLQQDIADLINDFQTDSGSIVAEMVGRRTTPKPEEMLNEVTLKASNAQQAIMGCIDSSVANAIELIESETMLDLSGGVSVNRFNEHNIPAITNKTDLFGKAVHVGSRMTMETMGGAAIGMLIGGIAGTVIPGVGNAFGAALGAKIGGALGGAHGARKGWQTRESENLQSAQIAVNNYIGGVVRGWSSDARRFVPQAFRNLERNLRDGIRQLIQDTEAEKQSLIAAARQNEEERNKAIVKYKAVKSEFDRLVAKHKPLFTEA